MHLICIAMETSDLSAASLPYTCSLVPGGLGRWRRRLSMGVRCHSEGRGTARYALVPQFPWK